MSRLAARQPGLVAALAAAGAIAAGCVMATRAHGGEPNALGERLYRQGILASGEPVRARLIGDVPAQGAQLVCAGCHGRSGLGSGEGRIFMPPVTGTILYRPREIRRKQLYDARTLRPAYTDATLARAIRDGVDPAGRPLDPMMPRYALSDADLASLIAYLKTLSSAPSPGVTESHIRFATVIAGEVAGRARKSVLDVLEAFVESKNADTRRETTLARRSPFHKAAHYEAYRKWALDVWELEGPPDAWPAQLEAHYAREPVFAVIGGVGAGSWAPVHAFCERNEVPCLLPNTDLPVLAERDFYTLYFTRGMALEAEVLARHLDDRRPAAPIVQVYRAEPRGAAAAGALRSALASRGARALRDEVIEPGEPAGPALGRALANGTGPALVLWLDDRDLPPLDRLAGAERVYLSSTLAGGLPREIPRDLDGRVYAVHPYHLPEEAASRLRAMSSWLRGRRVAVGDERLQANTLFTANLVAQALKHVRSNFHRDYFVQRIEHIFDGMVTPAAYPKASLGPNQRYASKGAYVVRAVRNANGEVDAESEWVVP